MKWYNIIKSKNLSLNLSLFIITNLKDIQSSGYIRQETATDRETVTRKIQKKIYKNNHIPPGTDIMTPCTYKYL